MADFPDVWEELQKIGRALEVHYRDACDIDFVIERGKIFVVNVRVARSTPKAALRIATDLWKEGVISAAEVIDRIALDQVIANLLDEISSTDGLQLLGNGLPASFGAATGRLLILGDSPRNDFPGWALTEPTVLIATEFYPHHLKIIKKSVGIVAARGGMTSHAAVIARAIGLPCVAGLDSLTVESVDRLIRTPARCCVEGEWVTIDGERGQIYGGRAQIKKADISDKIGLLALVRVTDLVLAEGGLQGEVMSKAWVIRDMLCHGWVPPMRDSEAEPLDPSIPAKGEVAEDIFRVEVHPENLRASFCLLYEGLLVTLGRLLARYVGLGRHWQFMRPLWDPLAAVRVTSQFIGVEFFNINYFVPHLVDISRITILLQVAVFSSGDFWQLDRTNPRGASLVPASWEIIGSRLWVNGAQVYSCDIHDFYHCFRLREYSHGWFEHSGVSREEIVDYLRSEIVDVRVDPELYRLAFQLGLVKQGRRTKVGRNLITLEQEEGLAVENVDLIGDHFSSVVRTLEKIVDNVAERGHRDRKVLYDDYSILLQRREFQDVVIGELYESYFPPSRHEFDYTLIREIVGAVAHNPAVSYAVGALAGGVIGNAAYDLVKRLAVVVAKKFHGVDEERVRIWETIHADTDKIESFFGNKERASAQDIINSTGIGRERLIPLLKLLGFSFERVRGQTGWVRTSQKGSGGSEAAKRRKG
jgi:phosphohistidine swiveling domain-containing protein